MGAMKYPVFVKFLTQVLYACIMHWACFCYLFNTPATVYARSIQVHAYGWDADIDCIMHETCIESGFTLYNVHSGFRPKLRELYGARVRGCTMDGELTQMREE